MAVALRSCFTIARTSLTNYPAPRGEPAAPLRSLDPTMIGAPNIVETITIRPRTPE